MRGRGVPSGAVGGRPGCARLGVDDRRPARRQPVADVERLGEPELLELADVALEARGVAARARAASSGARTVGDRSMIANVARVHGPIDDARSSRSSRSRIGHLVGVRARGAQLLARVGSAWRRPTRQTGRSALASSIRRSSMTDFAPARRASSAVMREGATLTTKSPRAGRRGCAAGCRRRPGAVPAPEREVDVTRPDGREGVRSDHHRRQPTGQPSASARPTEPVAG